MPPESNGFTQTHDITAGSTHTAISLPALILVIGLVVLAGCADQPAAGPGKTTATVPSPLPVGPTAPANPVVPTNTSAPVQPAGSVVATPQVAKAALPPDNDPSRYHNAQQGYSIKLPPDWKPNEQKRGMFMSPKLGDADYFVENLTLMIPTDISPNATAYLDKLLDQLRKGMPTLREVERWDVEMDGRPALAMEYTYDQSLLEAASVMYMVQDGNRFGICIFTATGSTIDDWRDEFEKSALTFRFDQATAPPTPTTAAGSPPTKIARKPRDSGVKPRTFTGHAGEVTSVCFSPDGKLLASSGRDKTIRIWDVDTGKTTQTLTGHTDNVRTAKFSPDGKRLASASYDKTIRIWDLSNGATLHTLNRHKDIAAHVAFSPDGTQLVSGCVDHSIYLWDANKGEFLRELAGHTQLINFVRFSRDGKSVVSTSHDCSIRFWDAATGKETRNVKTLPAFAAGFDISPDAGQFANPEGKDIKFWDLATAKLSRTLQVDKQTIANVTYSPDGKHLAVGCWDRSIRILDLATGQPTFKLTGLAAVPLAIAWSPDGKSVALGTADQFVKIWSLGTK